MTDHSAGRASASDKAEQLSEHAHSGALVYPTLAGGVVVAAGAAWTLGNFVEIIPASFISRDFDIHWINIEDASADDVYEIHLFNATTWMTSKKFVVTLTTGLRVTLPPLRTQSDVQLKNSQIQAKIASATGGNNATVSLEYHVY